jgi:hypothetical protein
LKKHLSGKKTPEDWEPIAEMDITLAGVELSTQFQRMSKNISGRYA